jgi:hypothetical protein
MAGTPTDYARVCLAAPPPASATLPLLSSLARATSYEGSRLCAFQVAKLVPIWLVPALWLLALIERFNTCHQLLTPRACPEVT